MEYFCIIRVYPEDSSGNFDFSAKTMEFQSMDGYYGWRTTREKGLLREYLSVYSKKNLTERDTWEIKNKFDKMSQEWFELVNKARTKYHFSPGYSEDYKTLDKDVENATKNRNKSFTDYVKAEFTKEEFSV